MYTELSEKDGPSPRRRRAGHVLLTAAGARPGAAAAALGAWATGSGASSTSTSSHTCCVTARTSSGCV